MNETTESKQTTTPEKPEMSTQEASWHQHIAGLREGQKARAMGADPNAVAAILTGAAGAREVAGFLLKPVSKGTVMTLKTAHSIYNEWAVENGVAGSAREQTELGLAVMVFQDPREMTKRLDAGKIAALVTDATDLVYDLPIEQFIELERFIRDQMDLVARLNGSPSPQPSTTEKPGKMEPTPSPSPQPPTTALTSESSNG